MGEIAVDVTVLERLHEAVGGDAEILNGVIGRYLAELDGRVAAIRGAVDGGSLLRSAHALASPSATLGIKAVAAPCQEIERRIEDGRTDGLADLRDQVATAARQAAADLQTWLTSR